MLIRYTRALLGLALLGLLAACGGTAATTTPAAVATTAPTIAATSAAPASAAASPAPSATPATVATPRAATPIGTPATPRATPGTPGTPGTPVRATPATPARPASPTTGGIVLTDTDNLCQVTLPATFTPDPAGGGNAVSGDERVGLNLLSFPEATFGFAGTVDFIIGTISASVEGYQEVGRESGTSRGRPYTSVAFQGASVGEPVAGRFYLVQEGPTVCALTVIMQAAAASEYAATVDALAESVQAVRP